MDGYIAYWYLVVTLLLASVHGIPKECFRVSNNTSVLKIECHRPTLTAIPNDLPSNLSELWIHSANIRTINETDLENVIALGTFVVENSHVENMEPGLFDHLSESLVNISLLGNHLTTLPNGLFLKLKNLEILNLNNNFLSTVDGLLSGLYNLQRLEIRNNHLTILNNSELSDLQDIKVIDASMNLLKTVNFSNLYTLNYLNLAGNMLTTIDDAFQSLANLQELKVTNNAIANLSDDVFDDLINITYIDIRNNKLTRLESHQFQNSMQLQWVLLSANPLETIDHALDENSNIHSLDLGNCSFRQLPRFPPPLIKALQLSNNKIIQIAKSDTQRYSQLGTLVLKNNGLKFVEPGAFALMPALKHIILNDNHLTDLPGPFHRDISAIQFDNNQISDISPDTFSNGTELEILSLRNNSIISLSPDTFVNVFSLKRLYLDNNPIRVLMLDNNTLPFVNGIEVLHLNKLDLLAIDADSFQGVASVKHLALSFVRVPKDQIHGDIFKHLQELETLQLQASPEIAHHFLTTNSSPFSALKEINLIDNNLVTFDMSIFTIAPIFSKVNLIGNMFHCNESIVWISQLYLIQPMLFPGFDRVVCHSPSHLSGRHVMQLTGADFDPDSSDSNGTIPPTSVYPDYFYEYYYIHTTEGPSVDHNIGHDYFPDNDDPGIYFPTQHTTEGASIEINTKDTSAWSEATFNLVTSPALDSNQPSTVSTPPPKAKPSGSNLIMDIGISAGTSVIVVFIILLVAFIVYKGCMFRQASSMHTDQIASVDQDVNIPVLITQTNKPEQKVHRKPSRSERVSTTSHASADITNQLDSSMKVYTLDTDV